MEKNSMSAKKFIEEHEGVWSMFDCMWKKLDKHQTQQNRSKNKIIS